MKRKILSICILLLTINAFILFFPYKEVIAFTYQDQDDLLAYLTLTEDNSFQVQYTHSIHLSEVVETYRLSRNHIIQTELSYEDFAVGMPSNAEGNEIFEEKNGIYYIRNMNRNFSFIDLRIGRVRANHRLIYKGDTYPLSKFIKPGTWVRIATKKISLMEELKGVNMNG